MKVKYLKLEGYANILAGMQRRTLEIDFSKSTNRVILLLGENGTGKTSILEQIQPYPFPIGSSRSGKTVLIDDTPAYKEIHYEKDNALYVIKHFIDKKGNVKSYISEDGNELNANGNVTSYKEIVEAVLHITEDTIKLMRLGTNSATFMKMSSSARKSFITELLNDVDIYSKLYKRINDNFRILRGLIKNVANKISSLNIGDLDTSREELSKFDNMIKDQNKLRDDLISEIGVTKSKVNNITDDEINDMRMELIELTREVRDIEESLSKLSGKSLKDISVELSKSKSVLQEKILRINTLEANILSSKDKVDDTLGEIDTLRSKLQIVQSSSEIGKLSELLIKVDAEIKDLESRFKEFDTNASLEDFKRLLEVYKDIDHKVSISHGFDHDVIKEIITMYLSEVNVEVKLNEQYRKYNNRIEELKAKIIAKQNKERGSKEATGYIIFKDNNCNCNCPFEAFYDAVTSKKEDDNDLEKELRSTMRKVDLIDEKFAVSSNINLIKMVLDANKTLISRLPNGMISFEKILTDMSNSRPIYDEAYLTKFISLMEEFENIDSLREKRLDIKEEINKIRGNSDTISYINEELLKYNTLVDVETNKITTMKNEIGFLEPDTQTLEFDVKYLEEIKTNLENSEILKTKRDMSVKRVTEIRETVHLVQETDSILDRLNSQIRTVDANITHLTNNRNDLVKRIDMMETLEKERATLEDKFEKLNYVRKSLSSTEGIPLIYIQLYMMDVNTNINKLLRRVYGGSFEIEEFIINEKEFLIPYIKNGVGVPDVSMCSQGEETFVQLALSFAFGRRDENGYNVMAMDELDGPLDGDKRDRFLDIFEDEMDATDTEQAFLISHNNVFDSYPVDAILTSPVKIDSFNNMNVIFRA